MSELDALFAAAAEAEEYTKGHTAQTLSALAVTMGPLLDDLPRGPSTWTTTVVPAPVTESSSQTKDPVENRPYSPTRPPTEDAYNPEEPLYPTPAPPPPAVNTKIPLPWEISLPFGTLAWHKHDSESIDDLPALPTIQSLRQYDEGEDAKVLRADPFVRVPGCWPMADLHARTYFCSGWHRNALSEIHKQPVHMVWFLQTTRLVSQAALLQLYWSRVLSWQVQHFSVVPADAEDLHTLQGKVLTVARAWEALQTSQLHRKVSAGMVMMDPTCSHEKRLKFLEECRATLQRVGKSKPLATRSEMTVVVTGWTPDLATEFVSGHAIEKWLCLFNRHAWHTPSRPLNKAPAGRARATEGGAREDEKETWLIWDECDPFMDKAGWTCHDCQKPRSSVERGTAWVDDFVEFWRIWNLAQHQYSTSDVEWGHRFLDWRNSHQNLNLSRFAQKNLLANVCGLMRPSDHWFRFGRHRRAFQLRFENSSYAEVFRFQNNPFMDTHGWNHHRSLVDHQPYPNIPLDTVWDTSRILEERRSNWRLTVLRPGGVWCAVLRANDRLYYIWPDETCGMATTTHSKSVLNCRSNLCAKQDDHDWWYDVPEPTGLVGVAYADGTFVALDVFCLPGHEALFACGRRQERAVLCASFCEAMDLPRLVHVPPLTPTTFVELFLSDSPDGDERVAYVYRGGPGQKIGDGPSGQWLRVPNRAPSARDLERLQRDNATRLEEEQQSVREREDALQRRRNGELPSRGRGRGRGRKSPERRRFHEAPPPSSSAYTSSHATSLPSVAPSSPSYTPGSPAYAPSSPSYVPPPSYTPAYAPSSPSYAPPPSAALSSPLHGPLPPPITDPHRPDLFY